MPLRHHRGAVFSRVALGLITLLAASAFAANRNEERVNRLPSATRKEFESFQALSVASLDELNQTTAPDRLAALTREILATGNLCVGSRGANFPVQQFLRSRLSALATNGVEFLGALKGSAMVPVTLPGTRARIGETTWPLRPLWPNGVMPTLCPTNGITGPLVDAGRGEWADIDGKELRGAVALMQFDGGRNWERLYAHGVRAVIVVESAGLMRQKAEGLFCNTPVPCPRFYVDQATGAALRQRVGQPCRLEGGAVYEPRPLESLFAYLPPTPPIQHIVRAGETLDQIAGRYGLKLDELTAANPTTKGAVTAGLTLTIPNAASSLLVLVPIDSVNVVPDAPHGAKVAANLAVALTALEHLASSPTAVRRKGIVFGFLDGEHLGGVASRALAENCLRNDTVWASAFVEDPAAVLARYRAVAGWFEDDRRVLSEEHAQWFGEQWLRVRLDEQRIGLAEQRADRLRAGLSTVELQTEIGRLVALNQATLADRRLDWRTRVTKFRAAHGTATSPWAGLHARFAAEQRQEEGRAAHDAGNRAVATAVRAKSNAVGFRLDLGDATGSMLIPDAAADKLNKRFRDVISFATVQGGWTEEWPFLIDEDRADVAFSVTTGALIYPECWATTGAQLFPLFTANDPLERLDTPADVVEQLNFKNLSAQARTAVLLWKLGLESPVDSLSATTNRKLPAFGRLVGRCVQFNVRSGIDAQQPVPESLVYYPSLPRQPMADEVNSATFRGSRRGIIVPTLLNGTFALPVESLDWNSPAKSKPHVYAYHLNREAAVIDMAVDRGRVGTQQQSPLFKLLLNQDIEKKMVLTAVRPLVFFPGLIPTDYRSIGGDQLVQVQDAVIKGAPDHFAYDNPGDAYGDGDIESNILYLPAGRRAQYIVRKGDSYKLLLVGAVTDATPEGAGLLVGGPQPTLPTTPLVAARQMYELAMRRQALYRRFGIFDQAVVGAVARAGEKLQLAEQAADRRQWQEVNGRAREAWGILVKYYPRIMTMGRQAVFSAVLLMAFLLPASAFAEKLLVGGKGIIARLVGTTVIFAIGVGLLNFIHPAFRISVSPFIIVIAYAMILMSSIVLVLCYQRFEVVVRRARAAGGEVESEEISVLNSLTTALALGVSNLKKRKTRTFLTALTVTALTFSIVTFVSVTGADSLLVRPLELDRDVEGRMVEPIPPKYAGVLLRAMFWGSIVEGMAQALDSEFGTHYEVTRRGHYLDREGGNNADTEGANQIELRTDQRRTIVMGVMAFEPQERDFSHLHEAVSGQQWFQPTDRRHVILPDEAAAALGITPAMLVNPDGTRKPDADLPAVRMLNRTWRVIGILDTKLADRYRDINGKSLAVVDYMRSAFNPNASSGDIAIEPTSYHVAWRRLVILPMAAKTEAQVSLRSVAIRFPEGADTQIFYRDLARRMDLAVFGTVDGRMNLITTKQKQSVGGMAKILVPVILCILIVTNTMLGAVEERKGEVGMLGAIGLSPSQISFLLLSESLVFSIIGIVCGTFGGLLFANVIPWIRLHTDSQFMAALSLNFASLTAIGLASGTGVVVLLATLFPAKKAAALAAPSGLEKWTLPPPAADGRIRYELPFTLTRGNAVGMTAFFRQFLLNHNEATSQDFNCRQVRLESGAALVLRCRMWLQPYDLDVAQEFAMHVQPTENTGIFAVVLTLHRTSGTEEAWLRTNYGFLDLVRRQFLIWRNLDDASRKRYIAQGAQQLESVA